MFYGAFGADAGATTPFIYVFTLREELYGLFEMVSGQRMFYSYFRPGGLRGASPQDHRDRPAFRGRLPPAAVRQRDLPGPHARLRHHLCRAGSARGSGSWTSGDRRGGDGTGGEGSRGIGVLLTAPTGGDGAHRR
jgi:hypothetical protein